MNYIAIVLIVGVVGYLFTKSRNGQAASTQSFRSVNVAEAKGIISSQKPTIIDVRTPMEVSSGKIPDALEINVASPAFKNEISKLDKSKPYLVYCRSGRRSVNACNIMSKEGFTNLYNLAGGYNAWK